MLILLETMAEERRTATAPELLDGDGRLAGGIRRRWQSCTTARGRRCTAWPYPT